MPIALFVHNESGELHPRTQELIEQVAQRVETGGIDAWFDLDPRELLGDEAEQYRKVTDVMDVWADFGRELRMRGPGSSRDGRARWRCTWKAPTSIAAGSTARC